MRPVAVAAVLGVRRRTVKTISRADVAVFFVAKVVFTTTAAAAGSLFSPAAVVDAAAPLIVAKSTATPIPGVLA
jgi:hypothetical protein